MRLKYFVHFALAATCGAYAVDSLALGLGRVRAAVIIGRPLDASVSVEVSAAESAELACVSVEVLSGDARLPATVTSGAGPGTGSMNVRIRTTAVVDEPVLTLIVRVGCTQMVTRRYVLLAEPAPDNAEVVPAPLPVLAVAAAPSVVAPAKAASSAVEAKAIPDGSSAVPAEGKKQPKRKKSGTPSSGGVSAPAAVVDGGNGERAPVAKKASKAERAALAGKASRLKLEPIDLRDDTSPVLRSSKDLLTDPAADPKQRAAFAALWQVLSRSPEDVAKSAQRLSALEDDIKAIKANSARQQQALDQTQGALAQRSAMLVWLWAALALLAVVAAGFALRLWWLRRRAPQSSGDWWQSEEEAPRAKTFNNSTQARDDANKRAAEAKLRAEKSAMATTGGMQAFGMPDPRGGLPRSSKGPTALTPPVAQPADVGFSDSGTGAVDFQPDPEWQKQSPRGSSSDFGQNSDFGVPRLVNAEELIDIQQQADFFISLGQQDQAIELLEAHIEETPDTSAIAYLDLFGLYHGLGKREPYEALRVRFNSTFNGNVPGFDQFNEDEEGLEAYDRALGRIVALWPSPKVLNIIEESLFRRPDAKGDGFNVGAYRELIFLYSVAKSIVEAADDAEAQFSGPGEMPARSKPTFSSTEISPLSASFAPPSQSLSLRAPSNFGALPDTIKPPASGRLGLDIDLDALPPTARANSPRGPAVDTSGDDTLQAPLDMDDDVKDSLLDFDPSHFLPPPEPKRK